MRKSFLALLIFCQVTLAGFGQELTFPYRLSPARDAILIGSGSLLLQFSALGHNQKERMEAPEIEALNPSNFNVIDRIATRYFEPRLNTLRESFEPSSAVVTAAAVATYGLYSKISTHRWDAAKTLGLMYLEGLYLSCGPMLLTKTLVYRPRPYTYNEDVPVSDRVRGANNESFFSGNATILFYHSVFLSSVYSDLFPESALKPWIWGATLSLATFSGFLSVRSGWHFPTDVLTGALVGGAAGYLIPRLHKSEAREHLVLMPWASSSGCGLSLSLAL
jgi:membrane-associated phospholipid phosphatase